MNRYKINEPRPEIDFNPKLSSRVKLTIAAIKKDEDLLMSSSHIGTLKKARGIITRDMGDGTWEVIWDGDVHQEIGLTFFPKKEWVELE